MSRCRSAAPSTRRWAMRATTPATISPDYGELSGVYWVWKNETKADLIGVCHYRRYLIDEEERLFTKEKLSALFSEYDILTSKKLRLEFPYAYGFVENHSKKDLDAACEAVSALYPAFYPLFAQRLQERLTTFGNLMICPRPLFGEYCAFLFPIFSYMDPLLDLDSYDDYHKRLYGFLSEFLLMVWCEYRGLRVLECKVGLVGEKKETGSATARLWEKLYEIGRAENSADVRGLIDDAKRGFLALHEQRPDILMEASDIHGYLHLCLQALSIAEHEWEQNGRLSFPLDLYGEQLMRYMEKLNRALIRTARGCAAKEDAAVLADPALSREALTVSLRLHCPETDPEAFIARHFS